MDDLDALTKVLVKIEQSLHAIATETARHNDLLAGVLNGKLKVDASGEIRTGA